MAGEQTLPFLREHLAIELADFLYGSNKFHDGQTQEFVAAFNRDFPESFGFSHLGIGTLDEDQMNATLRQLFRTHLDVDTMRSSTYARGDAKDSGPNEMFYLVPQGDGKFESLPETELTMNCIDFIEEFCEGHLPLTPSVNSQAQIDLLRGPKTVLGRQSEVFGKDVLKTLTYQWQQSAAQKTRLSQSPLWREGGVAEKLFSNLYVQMLESRQAGQDPVDLLNQQVDQLEEWLGTPIDDEVRIDILATYASHAVDDLPRLQESPEVEQEYLRELAAMDQGQRLGRLRAMQESDLAQMVRTLSLSAAFAANIAAGLQLQKSQTPATGPLDVEQPIPTEQVTQSYMDSVFHNIVTPSLIEQGQQNIAIEEAMKQFSEVVPMDSVAAQPNTDTLSTHKQAPAAEHKKAEEKVEEKKAETPTDTLAHIPQSVKEEAQKAVAPTKKLTADVQKIQPRAHAAALNIKAKHSFNGGIEKGDAKYMDYDVCQRTFTAAKNAISDTDLFKVFATEWVEEVEGFEEKAYTDAVGKRTVGFGFNLDRGGKKNPHEGRDFIKNNLGFTNKQYKLLYNGSIKLSDGQAMKLVEADMPRFKNGVVSRIGQETWDTLNNTQKFALLDLAFNGGSGIIHDELAAQIKQDAKTGDFSKCSSMITDKLNGSGLYGGYKRRLANGMFMAATDTQSFDAIASTMGFKTSVLCRYALPEAIKEAKQRNPGQPYNINLMSGRDDLDLNKLGNTMKQHGNGTLYAAGKQLTCTAGKISVTDLTGPSHAQQVQLASAKPNSGRHL